jgi:hypothetical protein
MSTIAAETMTALAADLTSAVKDIRAARLAFRASIRAIREAGDWTATEHKSWTTFAADVVSKALPKNAAAIDWTIVAVACAEEGMSVRTIAPVVGKSPAGVSKAIRAAIVTGEAEVPETSTGADGTRRKTARGARATAAKTTTKASAASDAASGAAPSHDVTAKVSPFVAAVAAAKDAVQKVRRQHKDGAALSATQRRAQINALEAIAANLAQEIAALKSADQRTTKAA